MLGKFLECSISPAAAVVRFTHPDDEALAVVMVERLRRPEWGEHIERTLIKVDQQGDPLGRAGYAGIKYVGTEPLRS